MKTLCKKAGFILILFLSISCIDSQVGWHRGNIVTRDRDVLPFTSVSTSDGWDLIIRQGEEYAMTIEANEGLIEKLRTEVKDGVLHIYSAKGAFNIGRSRIYLTYKELNSITASGGSDIVAETVVTSEMFELNLSGGSDLERFGFDGSRLTAEFSGGSDAFIDFDSIQHIEITASGGSDLELRGIAGETCDLRLGGGSDAYLIGITNTLFIKANGGSDIEASGLDTRDCTLDLSGSSDGEMGFIETLSIELSGGSDFSCKGNPQIIAMDACSSCDLDIE